MRTAPLAPGLLSCLENMPAKVALLRASRVGDFICATPAFRALRAALPQAEITMITLPMLKDLVLRSPHLDRYVAFPGFPGLAEQFFEPRRVTRFFEAMQAKEFDLAIQMQGSGVNSNPFTLMLGARATAGFIRPEDMPGRLDAALPMPVSGHEVQRLLALTTFLGAAPQGEETEFPLWAEDHAAARTLLTEAEPPFIGLHPSARDITRRWARERFAAVGAQLWQQHGGTVLVFGEKEEWDTAEWVAREAGCPALNLAGRTSLATLGAVISRLAILVTNDTGPAHIAYTLGTPTVTIFGGGDPVRYGSPAGTSSLALLEPVPCRPCSYVACPIGYLCLSRIAVPQVVEAASALVTPIREGAIL